MIKQKPNGSSLPSNGVGPDSHHKHLQAVAGADTTVTTTELHHLEKDAGAASSTRFFGQCKNFELKTTKSAEKLRKFIYNVKTKPNAWGIFSLCQFDKTRRKNWFKIFRLKNCPSFCTFSRSESHLWLIATVGPAGSQMKQTHVKFKNLKAEAK